MGDGRGARGAGRASPRRGLVRRGSARGHARAAGRAHRAGTGERQPGGRHRSAGPPGVGIVLHADVLGVAFALLSVLVLLAATAHEVLAGVRERVFPGLVLLLACGLTGLFLTGDVFNFYVFFELAMTASYALTTYGGGGASCGRRWSSPRSTCWGRSSSCSRWPARYHVTGRSRCATWPSGCPASTQRGDPDRHRLLHRVQRQARAVPLPLLAADGLRGLPARGRGDPQRRRGEHRGLRAAAVRRRDVPRPAAARRHHARSCSARRRWSTARCWRWPAATWGSRWPTPRSGRSGTCWSPSASAVLSGCTAAVLVQRRQRAEQDAAVPGRRDPGSAGGRRVRGRGAQRRRSAARGGLRRQAGDVPRRHRRRSVPLVVLLVAGSALSLVYMFQIYQRRFWRDDPLAHGPASPLPAAPAHRGGGAARPRRPALWPEPLLAVERQSRGGAARGPADEGRSGMSPGERGVAGRRAHRDLPAGADERCTRATSSPASSCR